MIEGREIKSNSDGRKMLVNEFFEKTNHGETWKIVEKNDDCSQSELEPRKKINKNE